MKKSKRPARPVLIITLSRQPYELYLYWYNQLRLMLITHSYWPNPEGGPQTQAIALGLGSMFNHSSLQQNVTWSRDLIARTIIYTAIKDINPGDELCISYGNARLWFKDADISEDDKQSANGDEFHQAGFTELNLV